MPFTKAAFRAKRKKREGKHSLSEDPYYMGDAAHHARKSENDNPFASGSDDAAEWLQGYREAKGVRTRFI